MSTNKKVLQAFAAASSIGINFAVSVFIGYYFGNLLDVKLGTTPVFLIIGILTGVAAGTWGTIHLVNTIWKEQ